MFTKNLKFGNFGKKNLEIDISGLYNKRILDKILKGIRGMRIDRSINYNNKLFLHVNNKVRLD